MTRHDAQHPASSGAPRHAAMPVLVAALMIGASTGCGALSSAHTLVSRAGELGSMANKISHAQKATFQATYSVDGRETVTVVQKPPAYAYVSAGNRIIVSGGHTFVCDTGSGRATCQRSPGTAADSADPSGALGVSGFVSGELALGVMSAALLVPKTHVVNSTATIAGQPVTCLTVSGLNQALSGGSGVLPSGEGDTGLSDFTACVTDGGVLARFAGGLTDGRRGDVQLTHYSATVDAALLAPPKGAKITTLTG